VAAVKSETFRPFESKVDLDQSLSLLRETLVGADDGELFFERRRSEVLVFDDGRVKNASYDASEGFGLRAVRGETAGYAHSTEISEQALRRAAETARLAVGAGRRDPCRRAASDQPAALYRRGSDGRGRVQRKSRHPAGDR